MKFILLLFINLIIVPELYNSSIVYSSNHQPPPQSKNNNNNDINNNNINNNNNNNTKINNKNNNYNSNNNIIGWNPENLAILMKNNYYLVNPDFNFTDEITMNNINIQSRKIQKILNNKFKIFIIKKISNDYSVSLSYKKDIDKFSSDLASILFKGDKIEDNTIFIVISISDKQIRIGVGKNLKQKLSSASITKIISTVSDYFKENSYEEGLFKLFDDIYIEISANKGKHITLILEILAISTAVFFLLYFVVTKCCCVNVEIIDPGAVAAAPSAKKSNALNSPDLEKGLIDAGNNGYSGHSANTGNSGNSGNIGRPAVNNGNKDKKIKSKDDLERFLNEGKRKNNAQKKNYIPIADESSI